VGLLSGNGLSFCGVKEWREPKVVVLGAKKWRESTAVVVGMKKCWEPTAVVVVVTNEWRGPMPVFCCCVIIVIGVCYLVSTVRTFNYLIAIIDRHQ